MTRANKTAQFSKSEADSVLNSDGKELKVPSLTLKKCLLKMLLRDSKKFATLIVNQTIQLELIKLSQKLWNIGDRKSVV